MVAVFTAFVLSEQAEFGTGFVGEAFSEVGLGVLWGVGLGCGGGYLLRVAAERHWAEPIWQQLLGRGVLSHTRLFLGWLGPRGTRLDRRGLVLRCGDE